MVQTYTLEASDFIEIINEYPIVRRSFVLRATRRRAHFLKVLDSLKHMHEIDRKKGSGDFAAQLFSDHTEEDIIGRETRLARKRGNLKVDPNKIALDTPDELMEQILKANILRMIDKMYAQMKVFVRNKKFDPDSLESRVKMLDYGFH